MTSSLIVSTPSLQNVPLQSSVDFPVFGEPTTSSSIQFQNPTSLSPLSSDSFAPPNKIRRLNDDPFAFYDNLKERDSKESDEEVKGLLARRSASSATATPLNLASLLPESVLYHSRGSSFKPSLAVLPSELVRVIISLVDAPRDRGCCALVCRAWRQWERATRTQLHLRGSLSDLPSLGACFDSVTDLDLADVHPDWPGSEEELRQVFRTSFPNLRRVRANVSPSGLEYVRQCWPKLESVVIGHWDGLDEGLQARHVSDLVARCPKVESIDLSWSRHCDFNELPKRMGALGLRRVRVLNLLGGPAPLRDDALEAFGRGAFPGLEELSFAMADGSITDAGIANVARGCPLLRVLRIEDVAHDLNDSDVDVDGADVDVDGGDVDVDGTENVADGLNSALPFPQASLEPLVMSSESSAPEGVAPEGVASYVVQGYEEVESGLPMDQYLRPAPPAAAAVAAYTALLDSPYASAPISRSPSYSSAGATASPDEASSTATAVVFSAPPEPPAIPTACLTYPITAAALESLARHCPNLQELCLVPSFYVHHCGPALEALAAGCKSLRVLRLTRFLGLSRGGGFSDREANCPASGSALLKVTQGLLVEGEAGEVAVQGEGLGLQRLVQEEEEEQDQQQQQGLEAQCAAAPISAPFVDETPGPPLLVSGYSSSWELDFNWDATDATDAVAADVAAGVAGVFDADMGDSLLADLQQWQQSQEEVEDQGDMVGFAAAAATGDSAFDTTSGASIGSADSTGIPDCLCNVTCTSGSNSTNFAYGSSSSNGSSSNGSSSNGASSSSSGSPRSPLSPPSLLPPPPLALFAALEELELQMCSDMTDSDVRAVLEGCQQLRKLEVVANHRISARAFALGCDVCASGVVQCATAAAGGSCSARGRALESVRVMQCDGVDSHALLLALMPARSSLKGIQMTASWSQGSSSTCSSGCGNPPPLPLGCFSALESLCLEVSIDTSLAPLLTAGLASCPKLKFLFLSLYGAIDTDTLPLPAHAYSLSFLAHPPALTYLFLSLEGVQCTSAAAMASLELALLAACPSLPLQEIEFRPAPCPVAPPPLSIDLLSPDAARLLSLSPCLRRVTLGGVVQEAALVKLLRSRTLRDVVFLMPPDCSDTFRSFFESVLKSRGYSDQPRGVGMQQCALDACVEKGCIAGI